MKSYRADPRSFVLRADGVRLTTRALIVAATTRLRAPGCEALAPLADDVMSDVRRVDAG